MTEADWLDQAVQWSRNSQTGFTIYMTFTFAYLTTAYFVGNRLQRKQAIIASGLYVIGAAAAAMACANGLAFYEQDIFHIPELVPAYFFVDGDFWFAALVPLMLGAILAGLYFMWSIRHSGKG